MLKGIPFSTTEQKIADFFDEYKVSTFTISTHMCVCLCVFVCVSVSCVCMCVFIGLVCIG